LEVKTPMENMEFHCRSKILASFGRASMKPQKTIPVHKNSAFVRIGRHWPTVL